jgi:hypothetical protein
MKSWINIQKSGVLLIARGDAIAIWREKQATEALCLHGQCVNFPKLNFRSPFSPIILLAPHHPRHLMGEYSALVLLD